MQLRGRDISINTEIMRINYEGLGTRLAPLNAKQWIVHEINHL